MTCTQGFSFIQIDLKKLIYNLNVNGHYTQIETSITTVIKYSALITFLLLFEHMQPIKT